MARAKLAIPSIGKHLMLPSDLVTKVDLILYSNLEGRVPHGAWQKYVIELIQKDLHTRQKGG